jgi:hypothetical protein
MVISAVLDQSSSSSTPIRRLIRHPDFPRKARFILVEFGDAQHQSALDRYVEGACRPAFIL